MVLSLETRFITVHLFLLWRRKYIHSSVFFLISEAAGDHYLISMSYSNYILVYNPIKFKITLKIFYIYRDIEVPCVTLCTFKAKQFKKKSNVFYLCLLTCIVFQLG